MKEQTFSVKRRYLAASNGSICFTSQGFYKQTGTLRKKEKNGYSYLKITNRSRYVFICIWVWTFGVYFEVRNANLANNEMQLSTNKWHNNFGAQEPGKWADFKWSTYI